MHDHQSTVLIANNRHLPTGRMRRESPSRAAIHIPRTVALGRIYIIEFGSLDSVQHSKHYDRLVPIRSIRANERITSNSERTDANTRNSSDQFERRRVAERVGDTRRTRIKRHDECYSVCTNEPLHIDSFSFFFALCIVPDAPRMFWKTIIHSLNCGYRSLKHEK